MKKTLSSQAKLKKDVLARSLCTGCGACVNLCPYQVIYSDRTVQLHHCDLNDGKCYKYCPRTPADYFRLQETLFDINRVNLEIGSVYGYYWSRAADAGLRAGAQHGGTVTALLEVLLDENFIDGAVVAARNKDAAPEGIVVKDKKELRRHKGSNYFVSPTVAAINGLADKKYENVEKVGVVATPCQALALAKMRLAATEKGEVTDKLKAIIGLFCGWTLSLDKFRELLRQNGLSLDAQTGMDIPAGKNVLELQTDNGHKTIPLDAVLDCIRTACRYCVDSTAEYADIAVGAARCADNPESASGWNQLIVRSTKGEEILKRAVASGVLEVREAPSGCLQDLKNAAASKKKIALENIVSLTGSGRNLLYLNVDDPVAKKYLAQAGKKSKKR